MESVYRPRPFDRFHRAGRQCTHCVRPPRHRPRHSPGRDNTDRLVTTRLPGCGNLKRSSRGGPPARRKGRPPPPQDLCSRASEVLARSTDFIGRAANARIAFDRHVTAHVTPPATPTGWSPPGYRAVETSSGRRAAGLRPVAKVAHPHHKTFARGLKLWACIEWSPSRKGWCIQDASGRCLAHCDAIQGQDVDAQTAVKLAKAMIRDGRMPCPEDAHEQLEERLRRDRLGEPMELLALREPMEPVADVVSVRRHRRQSRSRSSASRTCRHGAGVVERREEEPHGRARRPRIVDREVGTAAGTLSKLRGGITIERELPAKTQLIG